MFEAYFDPPELEECNQHKGCDYCGDCHIPACDYYVPKCSGAAEEIIQKSYMRNHPFLVQADHLNADGTHTEKYYDDRVAYTWKAVEYSHIHYAIFAEAMVDFFKVCGDYIKQEGA